MKDSFNYNKSLGQNFLINNSIIQRIVKIANIKSDDLVIEIGAGNGALTRELVKTGAQIISYEIDERLKPELEKLKFDNLNFIFEDFLKSNVASLIKKYTYNHLIVVGNLPYYITTSIVNKLCNELDCDKVLIMIQKETADRLFANINTKDYNYINVLLKYMFNMSKELQVSRKNFYPCPKIDSTVIMFRKKKRIKVKDEKFFLNLVKSAFRYKRKNIKNNLSNYDMNIINKTLETIGKDFTCRAENLTVSDFAKISNSLTK